MEKKAIKEHEEKLRMLMSTFTEKQMELFNDWQNTVIYLDSLIAIENQRIGFEKGIQTATELLTASFPQSNTCP